MQLAYIISLGIISSSIFILIWVWFWTIKQKADNKAILSAFVGGVLTFLLALLFEKILEIFIPGSSPIIVFLQAIIEETLKVLVVLCVIHFNKPDGIKIIVYAIVTALGFAFLENILFAVNHSISIDYFNGLLNNTQRSIGATFLHIVSSGVIGVALAFSYYKSKKWIVIITSLALVIAVIIHAVYNLIVVRLDSLNDWFGLTFIILWILTFALAYIVFRKEGLKILMRQIGILMLIIAIIFSIIVYLKPKVIKYTPEELNYWQSALKNVEESRAGFVDTNNELNESFSSIDSIYLHLKDIIKTLEENGDFTNEDRKFMENYNAYVDQYNCILRKEEVRDSIEKCLPPF